MTARGTTFKNSRAARLAGIAMLAMSILGWPTAASAEYPERAITIVVPFAAGGPTDIISRLVAVPMSQTLGQQVLIENVVGAGGTIGVMAQAISFLNLKLTKQEGEQSRYSCPACKGDPFAVGRGRFEAAVEHVGSDGRGLTLAQVGRQTAPARACFKGL